MIHPRRPAGMNCVQTNPSSRGRLIKYFHGGILWDTVIYYLSDDENSLVGVSFTIDERGAFLEEEHSHSVCLYHMPVIDVFFCVRRDTV